MPWRQIHKTNLRAISSFCRKNKIIENVNITLPAATDEFLTLECLQYVFFNIFVINNNLASNNEIQSQF
jgi:hypothetical protein